MGRGPSSGSSTILENMHFSSNLRSADVQFPERFPPIATVVGKLLGFSPHLRSFMVIDNYKTNIYIYETRW